MICYQDEKMYGPPVDSVSVEELDRKIKILETEIYGKPISSDQEGKYDKKSMIFDVAKGKLVERVN